MFWKPNKWLALVLGFLVPPLGLLYVRRWLPAVLYLFAAVAGIAIEARLGGPGLFVLALNIAAAAYAYRVATKAAPVAQRHWYGRWYGMAAVVAGFVLTVTLVRLLLAEPFQVPSSSMEPALPVGTIFVAGKLGYGNLVAYGVSVKAAPPSRDMRRGAIVVFFDPRGTPRQFVKRLVGLPGDTLEYRDKALFLNGAAIALGRATLDANRVLITEKLDGVAYETIVDTTVPALDWRLVVPAGRYYVMGDNRDLADDSRQFGPLKGELLVGEVAFVLLRGAVSAVR